ncbi:phosphomannomutase [Pseudoroseicyclus tamaricis]|uniref:Phosphomannomutase n=1 Tax=Pseudoroseicyclus tamaricis TaxID=2705421 RepID=A0A6B2K472_9RHOB|nr:phosphomannomutase [Pseudoroseicyclus tamaricis]NDV02622.1 phosphomannomutase [Pseudoroseicyclus tamaricis]
MAPKFGTSGLRGLVTELTDDLVGAHVAAFVRACETGTGLYVGRDYRSSSPAISDSVTRAARAMGLRVTDCGAVPTPALALAAMEAGACAVMVTGSHIPADRNGLKFYTPTGEITKEDEAAILSELSEAPSGEGPEPIAAPGAGRAYLARYTRAYGPAALEGLRIGLYAHSAVGRDLLHSCLTALGAEVTELARAEHFIPVDTEAVSAELRHNLRDWASAGSLDAIVSTDGDGDRPLLADATGRVIPGDILGQITAQSLGAEIVVTPVSSNTGAEASGAFTEVIRTRIGSPYVIAGMARAGGRVVGYEANGGFLLGFDAEGPAGALPRLMTRDALLPLIAPLAAAKAAGQSVAERAAAEPARFTAADRLQEMPSGRSQAFLRQLRTDPAARSDLLADLNETEKALDETDGLRLTLASGRILHLRPSGNAPEFRVYAEADTPEAAEQLMHRAFDLLKQRV